MILKRISLQNIRSYKNLEVDFPTGSTLLSGDIGSGKTSILLAIEFALFGLQPSQRGSSLLRNDATEGRIIMDFEVDEKKITIERSLKRGSKSITQDYCAITLNGERQELSVTESKNLILEILNYPTEFAKKQNILYRFTVYTPQEEMKQIMLQDARTRLNTLRQVFGVDKYKRILENTSLLTSKIREEMRFLKSMSEGLEQKKISIQEKTEELEGKQANVSSIEKELFLKTEERKLKEEEKSELENKILEKRKFEQEIEKTNILISTKKETLANNSRLVDELKKQIHELQILSFNESKIYDLELKLMQLKKEKEDLAEKNTKTSSKIQILEMRIIDNDTLKGKLSKIEICPTCLQNVEPVYKSNVSNKLDNENSQAKTEIADLRTEKKILQEKILESNSKIPAIEKEILELKMLKVRLQGIEEKQLRQKNLETQNLALEQDIKFLQSHSQEISEAILSFQKYENLFQI